MSPNLIWTSRALDPIFIQKQVAMSDRSPSEESQIKFLKILCCPDCYKSLSEDNECKSCLKVYPEYGGVVAPISDTILQKEIKHTFILKKTLKDKIKNNIPMPDERVWSPKAKKLIKEHYC